MTGGAGEDRAGKAAAVLAAEGLSWPVRSAGMEGEIAAVAAPPSSLEAVRRVAPALRSLGYRYVALDLAGAEHSTGE